MHLLGLSFKLFFAAVYSYASTVCVSIYDEALQVHVLYTHATELISQVNS
jgi:hypothetical protein